MSVITIQSGHLRLENIHNEKVPVFIINRDKGRILKEPSRFELILNDQDLSDLVIELLRMNGKGILSDKSLSASLKQLIK